MNSSLPDGPDDEPSTPHAGGGGSLGHGFPATPWTALVLGSGEDEMTSNKAWEQLARAYWKPLYTFLRRRGNDHHSAADDIQGFFAHLLQRDFLRRIGRGEGLFRSFLLTSLKNWRTDQHRAANAQKRGGGATPPSLEELEAASMMPVVDTDSPEEAFDRTWARTVYQNALATLEKRLESRGRGVLFARIRGALTGGDLAKYQEIADELGMKEGAVKQAVLDLRREFGRVLRDEIRRTVVSDEQIEDEIRYLLGLFSGSDAP